VLKVWIFFINISSLGLHSEARAWRFGQKNNFVSSFQSPSQALDTENLVLALGKMGKKIKIRIFIYLFLNIFSKKIFLYQATSPPTKLSVPRAWFWPRESWGKKKTIFYFFIFLKK
jgi:hypothetical protein